MSLAGLVDAERRARLAAVRAAAGPGLAYALRRLLFADEDAGVRAAAAGRLGELAEPRGEGRARRTAGAGSLASERRTADAGSLAPERQTVEDRGAARRALEGRSLASEGRTADAGADRGEIEAWLLEAIGDRLPLVRDAVIRALAACGSAAARPALRACVRGDRVWWVRRAAVYALAAVGEAGELAALEAALGDPFWRVRHAAVKVLAVLGRAPEVRAQLLAAPASDALTYLRASWGPVAIEAPARAAQASALPAALLDPDPAVVTARLATDVEATPTALVELLCDPHVALRELAAARIAASGDAAAYRAALDWLEEPRVPHVADTVERLLDGLGDPATALAAEALARTDRPGAARWAVGWVVATRSRELYAAACAHPALRREAVPIADEAALVAWADDAAPDPLEAGALLDAIAGELHARGAHEALRRLDGARPRVRALQLDAAGQGGDWAAIEAALGDPHHGPRAIAARWWGKRHPYCPVDRDPAVREAALGPATAAALVGDPDPFVARAAIEQLARPRRPTPAAPPPARRSPLRTPGSAPRRASSPTTPPACSPASPTPRRWCAAPRSRPSRPAPTPRSPRSTPRSPGPGSPATSTTPRSPASRRSRPPPRRAPRPRRRSRRPPSSIARSRAPASRSRRSSCPAPSTSPPTPTRSPPRTASTPGSGSPATTSSPASCAATGPAASSPAATTPTPRRSPPTSTARAAGSAAISSTSSCCSGRARRPASTPPCSPPSSASGAPARSARSASRPTTAASRAPRSPPRRGTS